MDGGGTWVNRSNGVAVSMVYDVDVAQSDGRMFGGGLQDNGTNITLTGKSDDLPRSPVAMADGCLSTRTTRDISTRRHKT